MSFSLRSFSLNPVDALERFEWVAHQENSIVINDSVILTSMDLGTKKPFGIQILDNVKFNKQKQDGRWDTWYGISKGTKLEWAGIQTLWTLKILKNYDRIES